MENLPPGSEVILAIFTSLLSLAVSLLLLKIQKASNNAIAEIENEKKIIKVKQSEIRELVSNKLTSAKETKEAWDFLENDLPTMFSELDNRFSSLNSQKPTVTFFVFSSVPIMLLALGGNVYLWYTIFSNGGKILISSLIIVAIITIFAMIYFGFVSWIMKRYKKDYSALKNRLDHISGEFMRAEEPSDSRISI